jgi:predicted Zn-dependent protease with MMP-like domain
VRRDRHGRGLRGPIAAGQVPIVEAPADRFDRLAADAVEHVEHRWRERLSQVEFVVDLVPSTDPDDTTDGEIESAGVPLARIVPAQGRHKAHIVLYRKPMELRARDLEDLQDLLHDVVVQVVANYLGLDPDVVDPGFGGVEDG